MRIAIDAACVCHTGNVRHHNEDNFSFARCYRKPNQDNLKHPLHSKKKCFSPTVFAVFDGMGGEEHGEIASLIAAKTWKRWRHRHITSHKNITNELPRLLSRLNLAIVQEQRRRHTQRMGTTVVSLVITSQQVYISNIGDSRAYVLSNGHLYQLSVDHVEARPSSYPTVKTPLTQHLGIDPSLMQLSPHTATRSVHAGDRYLLCSDGVTDMLTNTKIYDIMQHTANAKECAEQILSAALKCGGRDNITAVVCNLI